MCNMLEVIAGAIVVGLDGIVAMFAIFFLAMKHALANLTLADLQVWSMLQYINVRQCEAALDEIAKRPIKHVRYSLYVTFKRPNIAPLAIVTTSARSAVRHRAVMMRDHRVQSWNCKRLN